MRAVRSSLIICLWIALSATTPAEAQDRAALDCNAALVRARPPAAGWAWLHPDTVVARYAGDLAAGAFARVARALAEDFDDNGPDDDPRARRFERQLDAFVRDMRVGETQRAAGVPTGDVVIANADRFTVAALQRSGAYVLFPDTPDSIRFAMGDDAEDPLRRELCWRAMAVDRVLTRFGAPDRERYVETLRGWERAWANYNQHGFGLYWWEHLLANWTDGDDARLVPPATQWIIAHPLITTEVAFTAGGDDTDWDHPRTFVFDIVGFVRYRDEWRSYRGGAVIASVGTGLPPGVGVAMHFGNHTTLGVVYRSSAGDGQRLGLVGSLDLPPILGLPSAWKDRQRIVEEAMDGAVAAIAGSN